MKLVLTFYDRGFFHTFEAVVETLALVYKEWGWKHRELPNDKKYLCEIINGLLYPSYLLHQHDVNENYGYNTESLKEYLIIGEENILLNNEIIPLLADPCECPDIAIFYDSTGEEFGEKEPCEILGLLERGLLDPKKYSGWENGYWWKSQKTNK